MDYSREARRLRHGQHYKMITIGRSKVEKALLKNWAFLKRIKRDGKTVGYTLYSTGIFGLPSFNRYYWINQRS